MGKYPADECAGAIIPAQQEEESRIRYRLRLRQTGKRKIPLRKKGTLNNLAGTLRSCGTDPYQKIHYTIIIPFVNDKSLRKR